MNHSAGRGWEGRAEGNKGWGEVAVKHIFLNFLFHHPAPEGTVSPHAGSESPTGKAHPWERPALSGRRTGTRCCPSATRTPDALHRLARPPRRRTRPGCPLAPPPHTPGNRWSGSPPHALSHHSHAASPPSRPRGSPPHRLTRPPPPTGRTRPLPGGSASPTQRRTPWARPGAEQPAERACAGRRPGSLTLNSGETCARFRDSSRLKENSTSASASRRR